MLSFPGSLKVFLALEPCDMRAGANTLAALVGERLKEQAPQRGALCVHQPAAPAPEDALLGWHWDVADDQAP